MRPAARYTLGVRSIQDTVVNAPRVAIFSGVTSNSEADVVFFIANDYYRTFVTDFLGFLPLLVKQNFAK
jgi:hypothetical protein